MSGEERLKTLGLLRLQTTLQREKAERNDQIFLPGTSDGTRGNS